MNYKNYELKIDFFFHFNFLNIDISVIIYAIDLNFFVSGPKVPLEGSVSQIFVLGFSFDFMQKNG